jgi:ubiquinone/menaquinone biosynthesis C-methylase UbiE
MSISSEQPGKQNERTYVLDAESTMEMARLLRLDQLLTRSMGGIFPENPDLTGVRRVLDLACGPGGWVLETARSYADMDVVGVDISERMITYANAQAEVQQRGNASFGVMDILQPLNFPDASFDLINARWLVGFMHTDRWSVLLQECLRLLRPGGLLRFTEFEWGFSNKPHFEKICNMCCQILGHAGHTFSPNGLHFGVLPVLPRLFRDAGLQHVAKMAHAIEVSADTEIRDSFYYDLSSVFQGAEPFIKKLDFLPLEEWQTLSQQSLIEMYEEDFCAMWILLSVWGRKPV